MSGSSDANTVNTFYVRNFRTPKFIARSVNTVKQNYLKAAVKTHLYWGSLIVLSHFTRSSESNIVFTQAMTKQCKIM